ncbi:MAG TPA: molybdopterin-dependent oxidoreductase [Bacteroidales bacterium]|nr:molybdopterin-dependent oxidoreductase [Bacteroidales bacterium]HOK75650.1 molybdopterin-dependent oxidoreductase [Bacteroidales bacterium]HOM41589.1 molybdopterin-dependent oxidoreductase [Bacteroidales bacterium]HPP93593.1 molybdopterin-dependent oxidoreductase [Bacteroidales bacterium]
MGSDGIFYTNRRSFMKWSAILGSSFLGRNSVFKEIFIPYNPEKPQDNESKIIRTGCPAHNCGGRCLLKVHVKDGIITRIETDDRPGDDISDPQLRACIRGRSYRKRQYHPDRLKYPLKRTGKRGEGKFERITWDEAYEIMYNEISRVIKQYGNSAIFIPYGTGSYTNLNGRWPAVRLMNLLGGSLGYYNSYSWACTNIATPYVYGTLNTGNQRQDWLNSKYIIMWGWNPAEMKDGTNSEYFIRRARENGARTVCIDPRLSMSAIALADEWIPIRPGTDAAMMSAMAYVIITEKLTDDDFIRRCCSGYDSTQMPAGCENEESYKDYILGTRDGIPKTPEWAEKITAVPAATIARIAREYATIKPAVLYQGYGMQRRAYGEQTVRAGAALSAITGNIGIPGGWASGLGSQAGGEPFWSVFPSGENPVKARIPVYLWTEAIIRGKEMGPADGVRGVAKLDNNIKLIWCIASNILINQHSNINRTAAILRDENLVEFIAVQDNFLTPSAMFADLVLPACTQFETWGVEDGWKYGEEVFLTPKIVEPLYESKSDYRICADLAKRFGVWNEFTAGGRDEKAWAEWIIDEIYRKTRFPEMPAFRELEKSNAGVYVKPVSKPVVAFADFRKDPVKYPLKTPTGKIELFSKPLHEMNNPEIPAVPKYIQEWESPFGKEAEKYPLQAIGHHYMPRVHSTHFNNEWTSEAFPQVVFMNKADADKRKIKNGDIVKVFNDRGALVARCRVTSKIMPGVIDIPQGAWYMPDKEGIDRGGNINVLTTERWTALAKGNPQHTIMVEVEKFKG